MKTVLVTGGNGFIGGYVVEELLRRDYHVVVLDTRFRQPIEGAELVLGDIRDATSVTEAIAHADGVIHLGGVLGTQETITNPRPAAETNIIGGLNVLEACAQYSLPMVYIAVGNYWMQNTYSISKSTVERFVQMFNAYRGTHFTVVRALNAYGPRQSAAAPYGPSRVRKVMPSLVCRALSGLPLELYGDGSQIMDMIYVADVANILVSALEATAVEGEMVSTTKYRDPFEAGTGRRTTVNDIAEIVAAEVELVTHQRVDINHLPMRPGEDEHSVVIGNPGSLLTLGIDATDFVPLEEGVRRAVAYFNQYLHPALSLVG